MWSGAHKQLEKLFSQVYTKYATFNCQGLNDDNKKSSLADDFLHHQITVMMLQNTRITDQGVYKITSSNGTELCLYNSSHQSTSHGVTGFLVTTKAEITFKSISERISILKTTMNKKKCCFVSVYAPTNESTVKDPEKTRTFYEQLSDIISNINRNVLIIIGDDFNAKAKMINRDSLLNKVIGKYRKSDINKNGEKLTELCNLHNLRITNTSFLGLRQRTSQLRTIMIELESSSDILIFDLYLKIFAIFIGNVDFYLRKNLFELKS